MVSSSMPLQASPPQLDFDEPLVFVTEAGERFRKQWSSFTGLDSGAKNRQARFECGVLLRFAASLRRLRCQLQHSCQAQERIKQLFARTG
jgi:hypothetical protein